MPNSPATGFMVLHSNQLEGLRDLAVQFIRNNPLPPLAPEVILVQSNGMKHWLELALAKNLGICAATHIELPSAKLWQIYRSVLGASHVPAHMPLDKSPLVWRILRRLPDLLAQPSFAPLKHYLGDVGAQNVALDRRAYQLASQVADVLDGYQNYRADWLDDWARGIDQLRTSAHLTQGPATPLPPAHAWQPALWRDLLDDLAADPMMQTMPVQGYRSRAEVHAAFVRALAQLPEGQRPAGVPHRLMVFGISSLPMQTVEALAALGRVCQVLMLVQNPCQHFWGHVVESRVPLAQLSQQRQAHKQGLPVPQSDGALSEQALYTLHTDAHPLLAAWGKQGRDYLHLLDGFDDVRRYQHQFQRVDVFIDPVQTALEAGRTPTVLAHLQSDLLNLAPVPHPAVAKPLHDHSIELLQTHSAQREVEVLHDRLLAWLDADANLKPTDIMVMVPDMAQFAPHIHAVFGRFAPHDSRHIPYTVADTTPRTEPLVQALDTLLQLPQLRITRLEWQSLFEVAAVRSRFGLQAHDVAQLDAWMTEAGVRWGLDAAHRQPWGMALDMADANQNSWLFGVERLLLGYAAGAEQMAWQQTMPQAGVGGLDAHVMDGLLQWLRHTHIALAKLRQNHTPSAWVGTLQQLVALFFKPNDEADERLLERIMAPLEVWLNECQIARLDSALPLAVVREHWMAQLQLPTMQRRFFGGGVQFATLMPMRSIPFKCVCMLGMNDGDYPRNQIPRDFDLMNSATHTGQWQNHWRAGDRSRREDDRYLFLEALLSAREKLYISWQGRRTNDHAIQPPSVLVAQLLDHLNAAWTGHTPDQPAFEAPLQPLHGFSEAYFRHGNDLYTYATDWQTAQHAAAPVPQRQLTDTTTTAPTTLELKHLQRLMRQPVEVFVRDRLRLHLDAPVQDDAQEEPFALDPLQTYALMTAVVQAPDPAQAMQALRLSGALALAGFGEMQQNQLLQQREALLSRFQDIEQEWPLTVPPQSHRFEWSTHTLYAEWAHPTDLWRTRPEHHDWLQVQLHPGSVLEGQGKVKHARTQTLTRLWLAHLAACASGTPTTSVQIGFNGAVQFAPLSQDVALAHLHDLVVLYGEAWQQPLPLARQTACAYLAALQREVGDATQAGALAAAKAVFEGHSHLTGEWKSHAALQRVFSDFSDLEPALPLLATRMYGAMVTSARLMSTSEAADAAGALS